ncbi:MAG: circularly permuted type 2 ATP-grasp protein [Methanolobus sp.]|nr:circularly permuted type 2 ATP-grasp protein [Methanolobus sp.]
MESKYTFKDYQLEGFYDELVDSSHAPRKGAQILDRRLDSLSSEELLAIQNSAEKAFFDLGITFTVYGDEMGTEKIFPFDIIPRIIEAYEWERLEKGLKQRIHALNLFIDDVYNDQKILKDNVVPRELVENSPCFFKECIGIKPPKRVWCHITGTDLIRDKAGTFYVLEDNLRCPSGVSYVLANRQILKRTFPQVFTRSKVRTIEDYPSLLLEKLYEVAPDAIERPNVVLLTPGCFNSAYYEHVFLAQQMGIALVEGSDLVVNEGYVYMRTTKGLEKVDVIYRRIGEDFLDPHVFRKNSLLGIPGVMDIYKKGNVTLVNAPGTGVADDKAIYAYVPRMIQYYLDEEPIIPNVPTYLCSEEQDLDYVLGHMDELVIKEANGAGGYGMLVGPRSSKEMQDAFAQKIKENPRNYIAQPMIALSRCPVITGDHFEGRHVDLRPYILYGREISVMPGGLTRVALKKGSIVVNSSQGGGSKDTWVLGK